MVRDPKRLMRVRIELTWMVGHLGHLHNTLTWAEGDQQALAPFVVDKLAHLQVEIEQGCTRSTWGEEVDVLVTKLPPAERKEVLHLFNTLYKRAHKKWLKHLTAHPARPLFKGRRPPQGLTWYFSK